LFPSIGKSLEGLYSKPAKGGDSIFSHARRYAAEEILHILEKRDCLPMEIVGTLTTLPSKPSDDAALSPITTGAGNFHQGWRNHAQSLRKVQRIRTYIPREAPRDMLANRDRIRGIRLS